MRLKFTKMQGLGNDFIVINAIEQKVQLNPEQIRHLADRHYGVGCDQVLLVEPGEAGTDFYYRIFNADGSEAEQCGNGARCFARFIQEQRLSDKQSLLVATRSGPIVLKQLTDGSVQVDMGEPRFEPAEIPFIADKNALTHSLQLDQEKVDLSVVSMGNPHAVITVNDVHLADVAHIGPQVESHPRFPKRVNVGFMQIVDQNRIMLRVYERGLGESEACGTGACAAVAIGRIQGLLSARVHVKLPGGTLIIEWEGQDHNLFMTGEAKTVFHGHIEI